MPALPARRIDRARRQIDPPRKRAVPVYTRIMQSTHIHARMHGSARIFTTASALPSAIRADKATKAPQAPCSSELASMNANLEVGAYALAMPAAAMMTRTLQDSFRPRCRRQSVLLGAIRSKPTARVARLNRGMPMYRRIASLASISTSELGGREDRDVFPDA